MSIFQTEMAIVPILQQIKIAMSFVELKDVGTKQSGSRNQALNNKSIFDSFQLIGPSNMDLRYRHHSFSYRALWQYATRQ